MSCVVRGCKSVWYPNCGVKFHGFPSDPDLRQAWLSKIPLKSNYYNTARICSLHFRSEDYDVNRPGRLLKSAIPKICGCCETLECLNIPSSSQETTCAKASAMPILEKYLDENEPPKKKQNVCSNPPAGICSQAMKTVLKDQPVLKDFSSQANIKTHSEVVLKKKNKVIQQKVNRQAKKIENMKELITVVKNYTSQSEIENILQGSPFRMSPAASFGQRWAEDNLTREASEDEVRILDLILKTCHNDEEEAAKRSRRYYTARGPGRLTELWHRRHPDDEDILSSCQDVYIVPLRARSLSGRRVTIVRLPAPLSDRPLSARALLARWLMIMDLRLKEDPTPGDEIVFIDVCDLQPSHLKNHFKGSYWKDFAWCIKSAYPTRFSEVHVINTSRLKTMSLLLLHIGLYPWRRKVLHIHTHADQIYNVDISPEGLPYEYGGRAGAMKDLNDEWTKKLLSSAKWLQTEERKFYETELKPKDKSRRSSLTLRGITSYDILTRTHSCRSLNRDDADEGTPGAYRTLRAMDKSFYV